MDLGGAVTIEQLTIGEQLYRSAIGLQPALMEIEMDGTVAALTEDVPRAPKIDRAAALRERSLLAAQALLGSLNAAYRAAFDTKETPWASR